MHPAGFRYQAELISEREEAELLTLFEALPFEPYVFRGRYEAKRLVVRFGWDYADGRTVLDPIAPLPESMHWLRVRAGAFAGIEAARLEETLVARYPPGAAIGWHRDAPMFGEVVAVSLLAPALLLLRRHRPEGGFERARFLLEPRSAYQLSGEARSAWQHSVLRVEGVRYSASFRTLRGHPIPVKSASPTATRVRGPLEPAIHKPSTDSSPKKGT